MEQTPDILTSIELTAMPDGTTVTLKTETGSTYILQKADGTWWLAADNTRNTISRSLQDGAWRVQPPTRIAVGEPVRLAAPDELPRESPERIPGGGKITSHVLAIVCATAPRNLGEALAARDRLGADGRGGPRGR